MLEDETNSQCETTSLSSDNTTIVTTNNKEGDPNLCSPIMISNHETSSNYLNSHAVNGTEKMRTKVNRPSIDPNLVCSNRYKYLVVDEESDFEDECVKNERQDTYQDTDFRNTRRPNVVINN